MEPEIWALSLVVTSPPTCTDMRASPAMEWYPPAAIDSRNSRPALTATEENSDSPICTVTVALWFALNAVIASGGANFIVALSSWMKAGGLLRLVVPTATAPGLSGAILGLPSVYSRKMRWTIGSFGGGCDISVAPVLSLPTRVLAPCLFPRPHYW